MLSLSQRYTAATTDAQRSLIQAAGQAMLAIYQGGAFDVYYILGAVATLIIWRDRTSCWQTLAAGALLTVMLAFSGHDVELIGIALVLGAVTLAQTIWGNTQRLHVG
jgi:hypothetical protein